MKACILILCFAIAFSVAQGPSHSFTADFTVTASTYSDGFFNGEIFYDWDTNEMLLQFPTAGQYAELYLFNAYNGYPGDITGQFTGQYLYKNSSVCFCETVTLSYSMPPLFLDPSTSGPANAPYDLSTSTWSIVSGSLTSYPMGSCQLYQNNDVFALATNLWLLPSTGAPCAFQLYDGRTFSLTNIQNGPPAAYFFDPPTNCKCGKPLDLVISLDRTGSIQNWEWIIEHQFTYNLSQAFQYGPLQTNLGIINWNSISWITIPLADGISNTAVTTAIDNMGCCGNPPATGADESCCCCGTPIGGGLYLGGQMMQTSLRPTATKVIILVTDGCQDRTFDPSTNPPTITDCVCSGTTEQSCETNLACVADIATYFTYVTNTIPGVKIIVVGVGGSTTICTQQLLQAAGGIQSNVYNPTSWGQLSGIVESLSATACSDNVTGCVDCCGICSCGTCITPTNCTNPNPCTDGVINPASGCCTTVPAVCNPKDACHTAACNPADILGCVQTPIPCPAGNNCTSFTCDTATGLCNSLHSPSPLCNIPFCTPANGTVVCNDNNMCTVDSCFNDSCVYSTTQCGKSNSCFTTSCAPATGCSTTPKPSCNDNNPCTIDTCSNSTGCVYTPVVCPATGNPCLNATCNKNLGGCITVRETCSNLTARNCSIATCNQTCAYVSVCVPPPPFTGSEATLEVVLAGALSGAAVIAIIVVAVVVAVGVGAGGAIAVASGGGLGGAAVTASNPLYKPSGNSGMNPLFNV